MPYVCNRCSRTVNKLVQLGDAETTAWISSENRIAMAQYDYVCAKCALELLDISDDDLASEEAPLLEDTNFVNVIEAQKDLMIAVSTGGPRIQEKNDEYQKRRKILFCIYMD